MSLAILDQPFIRQTLFFPRSDQPEPSHTKRVDGVIPTDSEVVLGYRLHLHEPNSPVVLFFHGNGEICSDYDSVAALYRDLGLALLVVDFRGYGWSTGEPTFKALLNDVEFIQAALANILEPHQLHLSPRYVMGRSLGSAPAIHIASLYPEAFQGVIIESGFAHILHLLLRRGFAPDILADGIDPIGNVRKIRDLQMPLLVIHGENDQLIPVSHGQDLYEASPALIKLIKRIPRAGHNDLMFQIDRYFAAIREWLLLIRNGNQGT